MQSPPTRFCTESRDFRFSRLVATVYFSLVFKLQSQSTLFYGFRFLRLVATVSFSLLFKVQSPSRFFCGFRCVRLVAVVPFSLVLKVQSPSTLFCGVRSFRPVLYLLPHLSNVYSVHSISMLLPFLFSAGLFRLLSLISFLWTAWAFGTIQGGALWCWLFLPDSCLRGAWADCWLIDKNWHVKLLIDREGIFDDRGSHPREQVFDDRDFHPRGRAWPRFCASAKWLLAYQSSHRQFFYMWGENSVFLIYPRKKK